MGESDSDDSENEGNMGNVSRVIMRPPGHSGKAKKGHLCFDASFETGNLGSVELVSTHEYDLYVRPDTCNPRLRLWFHFTVDNTKPDQRILLNIVNMNNKKNSFRYGMVPIVKSLKRPIWHRMPKNNVFYHSSPYHNNNYVLSLAFNFDKEEDVYQFAFCFPYSYTKHQAHLDLLEKRKLPYFKREILGYSLQKKRVDLVTITDPKNMIPNKKVRMIIILARVHAGESPSSFVCHGMIDFLISNHPTAVYLRENIVFKFIPMLNPDGVYLGNYKCNQMGADLNRSWGKISKWLHPTIQAAYGYITQLNRDKDIEIDFIIDLHAHPNLHGSFIYGNTYNDVYRYERHIVFPKLLSQNVLGFDSRNTLFNKDINRSNSARRVLCDVLNDSVNCYTFLISFHGYFQQNKNFHYYNEDTYFKVGRNIVQTFLEYYRAVGIFENVDQTSKQDETSIKRKTLFHRPWKIYSAKPTRKLNHFSDSMTDAYFSNIMSFPKLELQLPVRRVICHKKPVYRKKQRNGNNFKISKSLQTTQKQISIIDFSLLASGKFINLPTD